MSGLPSGGSSASPLNKHSGESTTEDLGQPSRQLPQQGAKHFTGTATKVPKQASHATADNNGQQTCLFPSESVCLGWQNRTIPVGSGLQNPGVICYINSTLQALFHIPAFANWIMSDSRHQQMCRQTSGFQKKCTVCLMSKTFKLSQQYTGSSFMASTITSRLSLICKDLSISRQEDAHEFLRYLMDSMEQSYVSVFEAGAMCLDNYSKRTTPINQIFEGYIRTEVTCGKCRYTSTTYQPFQDINLDIAQSKTVDGALKKYFEKEPLDDSYACEKCRFRGVAYKQCSMEKAPNVLCIQLKRYSVGLDGLPSGHKNTKPIEVNEIIDMSKFESHNDRNDAERCITIDTTKRYRLVSMVIHYGSSLNGGHYTALGLTPSGSYYYFNDQSVCV